MYRKGEIYLVSYYKKLYYAKVGKIFEDGRFAWSHKEEVPFTFKMQNGKRRTLLLFEGNKHLIKYICNGQIEERCTKCGNKFVCWTNEK
jgi:hypothetical protein